MPQHRNDEPNDQPRDDLRARVGDLTLHVVNGFNRVDAELRGLRQEMNERFEAQRAEIKGDLNDLRTEIKDDLNAHRVEMKGDFKDLRTETKGDIAELRRTVNRFGTGLILAQLAVIGTLLVAM